MLAKFLFQLVWAHRREGKSASSTPNFDAASPCAPPMPQSCLGLVVPLLVRLSLFAASILLNQSYHATAAHMASPITSLHRNLHTSSASPPPQMPPSASIPIVCALKDTFTQGHRLSDAALHPAYTLMPHSASPVLWHQTLLKPRTSRLIVALVPLSLCLVIVPTPPSRSHGLAPLGQKGLGPAPSRMDL